MSLYLKPIDLSKYENSNVIVSYRNGKQRSGKVEKIDLNYLWDTRTPYVVNDKDKDNYTYTQDGFRHGDLTPSPEDIVYIIRDA